jgi:hypothetical protein
LTTRIVVRSRRAAISNGGVVTINLAVGPVVSLIAGILILIVPRLLNYIVAIYLILIGLIGIFGWSGTHIRSAASEDFGRAVAAVQTSEQALLQPATLRFEARGDTR